MGGGSPSPPPDYTQEKSVIRADTEKRYQNQANTYNNKVDKYNKSVNNFSNQFSGLNSNIQNMSYVDMYDNPNTKKNENLYSTYNNQLNSLNSGLGGLNFNTSRPTFSSSVGSEYGSVGISNIPTLKNANTTKYDAMMYGGVSGLQSKLNSMKSERTAEENRVNQYRNNANSTLGTYSKDLSRMGIADISKMNQMERDLASMKSARDSFSSPILNQMYPNGFSNFDRQYKTLAADLDGLYSARGDEQDRIKAYERSLLDSSDTYSTTLSGYDITNEQGIKDLQASIEQKERDANRFTSELGFDFSQELGELGDVSQNVDNLWTDRTNELGRIDSAQTAYNLAAQGLDGYIDNAGIYNKQTLDDYGQDITDMRSDIGGFTSLLDFDFSNANTELDEAQTSLDGVNTRRQDALNVLDADITANSGSALADLQLYEEGAMRDMASSLSDTGYELSNFSGGRVGDITTRLGTASDAVTGKLEELSTYRNDLEKRAQTLQEQLNNRSFYEVGMVDGEQGGFDSMQAEVELYNAQQAMDEIAGMEDRLNSERGRLEADAETAGERDRISREDILSMVGENGLPEFGDLSQLDPMALEEYLKLMNGEEEEEEFGMNSANPSAFSQNVTRI